MPTQDTSDIVLTIFFLHGSYLVYVILNYTYINIVIPRYNVIVSDSTKQTTTLKRGNKMKTLCTVWFKNALKLGA